MKTPPNNNVTLNAVSCTSASYCMAVGGGAFQGFGPPSAEIYDGSSWLPVAVPSDANLLYGVACTGATFCIAVGDTSPATNDFVAQAWKWDGEGWTDLPTFNPPKSSSNVLVGIECHGKSSCEAVGARGRYPLAEFWDGQSWTQQITTGAPFGSLSSVSCLSASACEAVGELPYGSGTFAMGWNGSQWSTQPTPKLRRLGPGPAKALTSISCYGSGCIAVGYDSYFNTPEDSGYDNVTEVYNGGTWALAARVGNGDPSPAVSTYINAVQCRSASDCTAVGGWTADNEGQPPLTLADTWNGTKWTVNKTPSPGSASDSYGGDELFGLSCTPAVCTAVGSQSTNNVGSLAERN